MCQESAQPACSSYGGDAIASYNKIYPIRKAIIITYDEEA